MRWPLPPGEFRQLRAAVGGSGVRGGGGGGGSDTVVTLGEDEQVLEVGDAVEVEVPGRDALQRGVADEGNVLHLGQDGLTFAPVAERRAAAAAVKGVGAGVAVNAVAAGAVVEAVVA